MSPLFLVNWHTLNVRFRALMWAVATVLAIVILVQSAPKPTGKPAHPRAPAAAVMTGGLRGRP
jgi:hypothetical protein